MMKNLINKMNQKRKKGFTLIELIIVIAIIAILAVVALPKFAAIRENANVKADISNAKSIQMEVISLISEDKIDAPQAGFNLLTAGPGTTTVAGMQGTLKIKANKNTEKGNSFWITIDNDGTVDVYAEADAGGKGTKIYPEGAEPYNGK